jgi:hypothetical protein
MKNTSDNNTIKPVAFYDPDRERELILKENKGRAGVYR